MVSALRLKKNLNIYVRQDGYSAKAKRLSEDVEDELS